MTKIFFHDDGSPSAHPTSKESAIRLRKPKYDDGIICGSCGICSIKYTINDECVHCSRLRSIDFYNSAVLGKSWERETTDEIKTALASFPQSDFEFFPRSPNEAAAIGSPVWVRLETCSRAGHVGVRTIEGACYLCENTQTKSSRVEARKAGEKWYIPDKPCPKCGKRAKRRVHDNQCLGCNDLKPTVSPRQIAIAAGEKWYKPETACPRCHTHALRHVDNGRCQGCRPPSSQQSDIAGQLMTEQPDMIIDRQAAKEIGLTVYRTGTPCTHGHAGWRYVSTGGCIDCLKGKSDKIDIDSFTQRDIVGSYGNRTFGRT